MPLAKKRAPSNMDTKGEVINNTNKLFNLDDDNNFVKPRTPSR